MNMKKLWKFTVIPVAALAILTACSNDEGSSIATVNGEKIPEQELNEMLQKQYGSAMLDTLISYKIVDLEAKKAEIELTDEEIDEEYATYIEQYGGEDSLASMLEEYNMSEEDVREDIRIYLLTMKLLESEVDITDEEIKTYFNDNIEQFSTADSITASHILVEEEALAKELIERIKAGEDFTVLAQEYSIEEGVDTTKGSIGTFGRGDMVTEFEDAAFAMEVGEVSSEPVKTEYGYHVILVEDKTVGDEADFKSSKDEVRQILLEEKIDEVYQPWLEEKYKEYDVKKTLFDS